MRAILDVLRAWDGAPGTEPELPDEPPHDPGQIRWSPGSLDGVAGRHFRPKRKRGAEKRVAKALRKGDFDELVRLSHDDDVFTRPTRSWSASAGCLTSSRRARRRSVE